jgi:hypothetical protein
VAARKRAGMLFRSIFPISFERIPATGRCVSNFTTSGPVSLRKVGGVQGCSDHF